MVCFTIDIIYSWQKFWTGYIYCSQRKTNWIKGKYHTRKKAKHIIVPVTILALDLILCKVKGMTISGECSILIFEIVQHLLNIKHFNIFHLKSPRLLLCSLKMLLCMYRLNLLCLRLKWSLFKKRYILTKNTYIRDCNIRRKNVNYKRRTDSIYSTTNGLVLQIKKTCKMAIMDSRLI